MAHARRPVHDHRRGRRVGTLSIPPLVVRAQDAARANGFAKSCRDEDGALLHVLASRRGVERVAEIGTGTGVGTAWLAAGLAPGVPLFTAELDPRLAAAAAEVFADDPDVHVLEGDWRVVLPAHAPFDLMYVDGGRAKDDPDAILGLATPGATIVMDDFSADWPGPDPRRTRWFAHPRVTATEIGTGGNAGAIVAVVRR
jgi:predicted O-methyltransferase YrrM